MEFRFVRNDDKLFLQFFKASDREWGPVTDCVKRKVTEAQNNELLLPIEYSELKKVLFDMHPDKSPGPDG